MTLFNNMIDVYLVIIKNSRPRDFYVFFSQALLHSDDDFNFSTNVGQWVMLKPIFIVLVALSFIKTVTLGTRRHEQIIILRTLHQNGNITSVAMKTKKDKHQ